MDLLTDVFLQCGLQRRLLDLRHLAPGTALRFPCDRSLGLHVVAQGRAWLHEAMPDGPIALQAGDIAVMARGSHHVLSTQAEPLPAPAPAATLAGPWGSLDGVPASVGDAVVISAAYQFWHAPLHPLFAQLPPWFVLRAESLPALGPLTLVLGLLQQELTQRHLGADAVVHGLMDVIFTYLLREVVERQGLAGAGWSQAVREPALRQVLALMHDDCAHPWTLDELASRCGLARTTLAERFRAALGDTPLNHLRTLRMQRAIALLGQPGRTLEQVAAAVGYQDAFSFSKVFKRVVGESPKAFRRRDAAERALPWRVGAG